MRCNPYMYRYQDEILVLWHSLIGHLYLKHICTIIYIIVAVSYIIFTPLYSWIFTEEMQVRHSDSIKTV